MIESDYYKRKEKVQPDGLSMFATDMDHRNEDDVLRIVEDVFEVKLRKFGMLCPIDYYALKEDRLAGLVEVKTRTHPSTKFPDVFLNVRKWLALGMAQNGLGCPAVFAVKFTDCVKAIEWDKIDATKISIAGCSRRVKSESDIEPVIHVPISEMTTIHTF